MLSNSLVPVLTFFFFPFLFSIQIRHFHSNNPVSYFRSSPVQNTYFRHWFDSSCWYNPAWSFFTWFVGNYWCDGIPWSDDNGGWWSIARYFVSWFVSSCWWSFAWSFFIWFVSSCWCSFAWSFFTWVTTCWVCTRCSNRYRSFCLFFFREIAFSVLFWTAVIRESEIHSMWQNDYSQYVISKQNIKSPSMMSNFFDFGWQQNVTIVHW